MKENPRTLVLVLGGVALLILLMAGLYFFVVAARGSSNKASSDIPPEFYTVTPPPILGVLPVQNSTLAEAADPLMRLTQWGAGRIRGLEWSPDGKQIAVIGERGVYLYDAETLIQTRLIQARAKVERIAFSPDSTLLAVSGQYEGIQLWRVRDGVLVRTLVEKEEWYPNALMVFSRDGKILATNIKGGILLWQLSSGRMSQFLGKPDDQEFGLAAMAFRADGKAMVGVTRYPDRVLTWSLDTSAPKVIGTLPLDNPTALSPDGTLIATGIHDKSTSVYRTDGTLLWKNTEVKGIGKLVFSPDAQSLAASPGSFANYVFLLDAQDGTLLRKFYVQGTVTLDMGMAFSPDGALFAAATAQTVRVWRVNDGTLLRESPEAVAQLWTVAFNTDGSLLAGGSQDRTVRIWKMSDGTLQRRLELSDEVLKVQFCPAGDCLATATRDNKVQLWGLNDTVRETWEGGKFAFAPGGKEIAVAASKTVRIYPLNGSAPPRELQGHTDLINAVAYSPNGQWIASASDDQTVRLWNAVDGSLVKVLSGHTDWVWDVAFSPDGETLISASRDGTLRAWRVSDGNLVREYKGGGGALTHVMFQPDGTFISFDAQNDLMQFWTLDSETPRRRVSQVGFAWAGAVHPDGTMLATGGNDGTISFWGSPATR